ncbi:MAG: hypothetical protein ABI675_24370 [Chitinophagaceae bacterium]
MLKILTSLTFLYAVAIIALLLYGFLYYRNFEKSRYQRSQFPIVFSIISAACISFLWINIHAPLRLETFSNLDHHFIRHDGFEVTRKIELGGTDTTNYKNNSFNRFILSKQNGQVGINAVYSEDPLYLEREDGYRILSKNYSAIGHTLSFQSSAGNISINAKQDNLIELKIGEKIFNREVVIKKAISGWNIFRDEDEFINSSYYNNQQLVTCLNNILLIRDDVSRRKAGELKYFLAGRLFSHAGKIKYDEVSVQMKDQQFAVSLPDQSNIAWGIGFLENNRNQFRVKYAGNDSFSLLSRYPVAYPLTEENRNDWRVHKVSKFLLSDGNDVHVIPSVFKEGFLFSSFSEDKSVNFSPVLLTYQKAGKNDSLQLTAQRLDNLKRSIEVKGARLLLPAKSTNFNWIFSIRNTYNWEFGNRILSDRGWQRLMFSSLGLFFLLIFFSSLVKPAGQQSWVWQVLSCVTIVLLTTRFLLYWRYKSFPPYEGMDLPSQQQLQSLSNFGIILFATIVLGLIFGYAFLKYIYQSLTVFATKLFNRSFDHHYESNNLAKIVKLKNLASRFSFSQQASTRTWFFITWLLILFIAGGIAGMNHFDAGVCRHLAIALMLFYFGYLFFSYKYSPLVASASESWWSVGTGKTPDIIISNPVKILLSISLLALFAFIDIGFAIVFLNFLLFNEAFLCINYSIAGLSAGSKRNAAIFGTAGIAYLLFFVLNLLYAPYVFKFLLTMAQPMYVAGYILFAIGIAYLITRLLAQVSFRKKILAGFASAVVLFCIAFFFFPKERILDKAAMTKYRIDVLTTPVDKAIASAYEEGKTYEPVIRAAQNQWFINTFIHEENNPQVQSVGFNLLPHAPQNKGAKYNAQATDLVTSRFLIAEHGKWSVLLYVLLLMLPAILFATFYKLYPDFTNRINTNYPAITAGFAVLNYLLITALLVILAATGRYIFFGQDLPFGSILSKQSILFPAILILGVVLLFKNIPQEHYANRRKALPGIIVFTLLFILLFFVKPEFNKNKEFAVEKLVNEMDSYVQLRLQPLIEYFDTSAKTRRLPLAKKDELFSDSLRKMISSGAMDGDNKFFSTEINAYARSGFSRHLDQRRMLYLDLYSGTPQLAVNDNYFRVEPPPHLQQSWQGNVLGDTSVYNIGLWDANTGSVISKRLSSFTNEPDWAINDDLGLSFRSPVVENIFRDLYLVNRSRSAVNIKYSGESILLQQNDSLKVYNPSRFAITDSASNKEQILTIEPDAFMKNYYVNGNRYYVYPMKEDFIWARNFAEAVSSDYTAAGDTKKNAFVSFDFELMDSLSAKIKVMMSKDTAYKTGAEYGICMADGNGRLIALTDYIKGLNRPDPNDKAGFNKVIMGENGFVSQSLLRKQIGNINLLRLNPGPGSTLKPIVFSAIASQLSWNWDAFAAEGFSEKQHYYGGEKVPEYDFEKSNGRINNVADYLKYSDNYYHSNVLLLGSYPKQDPTMILSKFFSETNPGTGLHWPYFTYTGKQYWMSGFQNWPGYLNREANFGLDSSFTSIGLFNNYGIYTHTVDKGFDMFGTPYDSLLFLNAYSKSGFILPEYALFDQRGDNVDHHIPYDLFTSCFRGHVKGSSQVMVPPAKMLEAFGKLVSQSRNYTLTLNPYATTPVFSSFDVDYTIPYNSYLSIIRENVFKGMREALFAGTAARLGSMLKGGTPYYYYAKTGTTGDDEVKTKSKLLTVIISSKDITDPDFNFRNNNFYTIYFTSENGPAKQNEEFQAEVIRYLQQTLVFNKYMKQSNKNGVAK